jgi:hypothetical protein
MSMTGKISKSDVDIVKITPKGDTAIVRTSMNYAMTMKDPTTKKDQHWTGKSLTDDTWKKVGKTWKLYRVEAISEEMTVDGKPFKM